MAKLILSLDSQVLKEYDINKERMTVGRKPHNDIQIDNLAVSGEHAMIMTILNDSFLEDLGSTNGTLVNGLPVKKHFLQSNDVIEIGKYKIKYLNEQTGKLTQPEFEKTMVLRNPGAPGAAKPKDLADTQTNPHALALEQGAPTAGQGPVPAVAPAPVAAPPAPAAPAAAPAAPPTALSATAPAAPPGGQGTIQILSGPNAGKELPLTKALTTVGKPGVQVSVIAKRPQGFFLTHVEGATFPVLNGKALDAQAHQLRDHDIIELAGVKMEFFLKP
jgi:pSer/pThr/pTyr-binding forkhead associated (FHA) protein